MTTTISAIETTVFRLPMYGALHWGQHSSLSEVRHVLVRVRLSDGSSGMAEAPPRPTIYGETVQSIVSIINTELSPRLLGQPAADVRAIYARMEQIKNNHAAKGGVDMALHAALAQSKGMSLAAHLGATQERIKVSYILGINNRDEMLAEAENVFQQGVRVFKVKVGRNWADDLARIAELQQIFGPALALYADANECMTPAEAPAKLEQLAEMGLLYCEEPLPVEQIQARATLRERRKALRGAPPSARATCSRPCGATMPATRCCANGSSTGCPSTATMWTRWTGTRPSGPIATLRWWVGTKPCAAARTNPVSTPSLRMCPWARTWARRPTDATPARHWPTAASRP